MKIFDCFTYNGEKDLLNLRLNLYKSKVDYFVIVESEIDFRGNKKSLKFDKKLLQKHKNIRYISLKKSDFFTLRENYNIEFQCRNAFMRGLFDLEDYDQVIISDIDEIISPNKFPTEDDDIRIYSMFWHYFYPANIALNSFWIHPTSFPGIYLKIYTPMQMRKGKHSIGAGLLVPLKRAKYIYNSGSHFSYFLKEKTENNDIYEIVQKKLNSFMESHVLSKCKKPKDLTRKEFFNLISHGIDFLGMNIIWVKVNNPFAHFEKKDQKILEKYLSYEKDFTNNFIKISNSKEISRFIHLLEKFYLWRFFQIGIKLYAFLIRKIFLK